jgi:hypothetical protein
MEATERIERSPRGYNALVLPLNEVASGGCDGRYPCGSHVVAVPGNRTPLVDL